jgi:hypothetical protein
MRGGIPEAAGAAFPIADLVGRKAVAEDRIALPFPGNASI